MDDDDDLATYIQEQFYAGKNFPLPMHNEDMPDLYTEYPIILPPGEIAIPPPPMEGEEGEDIGPFYPEERRISLDPEEKLKQQLVKSFYEIVAGRQELRRKNMFLHKKLVEFFKKRMCEHVLIEDPKRFDLESKYIKRLFELEQSKKEVAKGRRILKARTDALTKALTENKERAEAEEKEYMDLQKKTVTSLYLKTGRKITNKMVVPILEEQQKSYKELQQLRLDDIILKTTLVKKNEILKNLDQLGCGLRRADYDKLMFEYHNECRKYKEKADEAEKLETKVESLADHLHSVQTNVKKLDEQLKEWRDRVSELKFELHSAKSRFQNLSIMRSQYQREFINLKKKMGLIMREDLLMNFQESLDEYEELKKEFEIESKIRNDQKRGRQSTVVDLHPTPVEEVEDLPLSGEDSFYAVQGDVFDDDIMLAFRKLM